jgi:hypothetical protein
LVSSVAHRSGKEISALDNTFALIDGYINADFLHPSTFPLQSDGGPYISEARNTAGVFHPGGILKAIVRILDFLANTGC